jgi:hypothetical protein
MVYRSTTIGPSLIQPTQQSIHQNSHNMQQFSMIKDRPKMEIPNTMPPLQNPNSLTIAQQPQLFQENSFETPGAVAGIRKPNNQPLQEIDVSRYLRKPKQTPPTPQFPPPFPFPGQQQQPSECQLVQYHLANCPSCNPAMQVTQTKPSRKFINLAIFIIAIYLASKLFAK